MLFKFLPYQRIIDIADADDVENYASELIDRWHGVVHYAVRNSKYLDESTKEYYNKVGHDGARVANFLGLIIDNGIEKATDEHYIKNMWNRCRYLHDQVNQMSLLVNLAVYSKEEEHAQYT